MATSGKWLRPAAVSDNGRWLATNSGGWWQLVVVDSGGRHLTRLMEKGKTSVRSVKKIMRRDKIEEKKLEQNKTNLKLVFLPN